MSLTRRLALLERAVMVDGERQARRFWSLVEADLTLAVFNQLIEESTDALYQAAEQVIARNSEAAAAWRAMDAAGRSRFLAIRCNAPPLPEDANVIAMFTGTDDEHAEAP